MPQEFFQIVAVVNVTCFYSPCFLKTSDQVGRQAGNFEVPHMILRALSDLYGVSDGFRGIVKSGDGIGLYFNVAFTRVFLAKLVEPGFNLFRVGDFADLHTQNFFQFLRPADQVSSPRSRIPFVNEALGNWKRNGDIAAGLAIIGGRRFSDGSTKLGLQVAAFAVKRNE